MAGPVFRAGLSNVKKARPRYLLACCKAAFLECGGKRSATPLCSASRVNWRSTCPRIRSLWKKRRRRFALPAQSKMPLLRRNLRLISLPRTARPPKITTMYRLNGFRSIAELIILEVRWTIVALLEISRGFERPSSCGTLLMSRSSRPKNSCLEP